MTRFAPRTTTSFSLFVLILKGMILKQAFPLKFRVWTEILWKKASDYEANFFLQNEILKWHFFKISDCELRIFRSGRFYNKKTFQIIIFWRKNIFQKLSFWVQFLLRNQISMKTSRLRNDVLTRFAPRTTTSFSLCVLILKGMTL